MATSSLDWFSVTNLAGLCDWPCHRPLRPYLTRENLAWARVAGLEEIFDKIDIIFSVRQPIV